MNKILALLMVAILFAGCASVGTEMDMTRMDEIEKGVTTRADLEQMFGKPLSVGITADGHTTASWIYSEARSKGLGYRTRMQQLVVIFTEANIVESFTFNEHAT